MDIGPGESCFIPRGAVHGFNNLKPADAKALAVITPALLGPDFFKEAAAIVNAGGPPDVEKLKAVMAKHGLVPAPAAGDLPMNSSRPPNPSRPGGRAEGVDLVVIGYCRIVLEGHAGGRGVARSRTAQGKPDGCVHGCTVAEHDSHAPADVERLVAFSIVEDPRPDEEKLGGGETVAGRVGLGHVRYVSIIHAIVCSLVLTSGAGTSFSGPKNSISSAV